MLDTKNTVTEIRMPLMNFSTEESQQRKELMNLKICQQKLPKQMQRKEAKNNSTDHPKREGQLQKVNMGIMEIPGKESNK